MSDQSELDRRYFLTHDKYNCPFCNRRSVVYSVVDSFDFHWSDDQKAYGYIVKCAGCEGTSLHLSYFRWRRYTSSSYAFQYAPDNMKEDDRKNYKRNDLDQYFFYHHPTSFFTLDERIPRIVRELIAEADGCRKMNWLVGASGALRKGIYKFLKDQKALLVRDDQGFSYEQQIKWLKDKYPLVAGEYFDALSNIQDMTSEELHETKDWDPWTRDEFDFLVATVKAVLHEIYVVPEERRGMIARVLKLGPEKKVAKKDEDEGGDINAN